MERRATRGGKAVGFSKVEIITQKKTRQNVDYSIVEKSGTSNILRDLTPYAAPITARRNSVPELSLNNSINLQSSLENLLEKSTQNEPINNSSEND